MKTKLFFVFFLIFLLFSFYSLSKRAKETIPNIVTESGDNIETEPIIEETEPIVIESGDNSCGPRLETSEFYNKELVVKTVTYTVGNGETKKVKEFSCKGCHWKCECDPDQNPLSVQPQGASAPILKSIEDQK